MYNTDPLYLPNRFAGAKESLIRMWKKTFVYSGRASRQEYFWGYFWQVIFSLVFTAIFMIFFINSLVTFFFDFLAHISEINSDTEIASVIFQYIGPIATAYFAFLIISFIISFPFISLTIRRLHDSNHSGWWWLLGIVALIFAFFKDDPQGARFDKAPADVSFDQGPAPDSGYAGPTVSPYNSQQ